MQAQKDALQKRMAAKDRIAGQRSFNLHKKNNEADALADKIGESQRKSEVFQKVVAVALSQFLCHIASPTNILYST